MLIFRAGARHRAAAGVFDRPAAAHPGRARHHRCRHDVRVDAARAADHDRPPARADIGVPLESVSSSMRTLIGGEEVSKYKDGDEQYTVRVRLDEQFRRDPLAMGDLFVQASGGRMVRVSDVARLTMENGPASIERLQPHAAVIIRVNARLGYATRPTGWARRSRPQAATVGHAAGFSRRATRSRSAAAPRRSKRRRATSRWPSCWRSSSCT